MTSTDIANKALGLLGISDIDSIDDNTPEAKAAKAWYDDSRETLIRTLSPSFARLEVALALVSGQTSVEWEYVYGFPADCVSIKKIYNPYGDDIISYEIGSHTSKTSKIILTDQEDATLIYYANIEDLNMFSSDQILALAYLLAKSLADTPIKRNPAKEQQMSSNFEFVLAKAMTSDKRDQKLELPKNDKYINARK